jgi:hypothetical protein
MALLGGVACDHRPDPGRPDVAGPGVALVGQAVEPVGTITFRAQDLPFRYDRGESGLALPVEVTGGGVGMLDYDGDGDLDLFFAQGVPLLPRTSNSPPADVLLRNEGRRAFVDVSKEVGLGFRGHGQGVTVADYDGDGDPDVYVTRYGPNTLWRNDGGRFTDATAEAGVGCPLWSLGAAFFDYDGDGDLDLFVANYFDFDPAGAPFHRDAAGRPEYGPPADFPGLPDVLYRNDGGSFTDVTPTAGVAGSGRAMGVLAADFDGDGRVDIFVANDAEANALWHNLGDGSFEDIAFERGLAYNGDVKAEANMGIARGDTDGDGLFDLLVTHFYDEHDTLWRGERAPAGLFYRDATRAAGLAVDSLPLTGWGCALADLNQDGRLDLVVTNGHIRREPRQTYPLENPPILWRGERGGRFRNVTRDAGAYFRRLHMGRGLACGDLDGDSDLDLVIVPHHAPATVLWNETRAAGRALLVELQGAGGNRDAIGATVTVRAAGRSIVRSVDGGGSYLSSHDRRLHFGLGGATRADSIEVRWPSGRIETRDDIPTGVLLRLQERP